MRSILGRRVRGKQEKGALTRCVCTFIDADMWIEVVVIPAACVLIFAALLVFAFLLCDKRKRIVQPRGSDEEIGGKGDLRSTILVGRRVEVGPVLPWLPPGAPQTPDDEKQRRLVEQQQEEERLRRLQQQERERRELEERLDLERRDRDERLLGRLAVVRRALAFDHQVSRFGGHRSEEDVALGSQARHRHIGRAPLTEEGAIEVCQRRGFVHRNTVLEEPSAFDLVFVEGFGAKIVTRERVTTFQCESMGGSWSCERLQSKCYGIFERGGHLLYNATLMTARTRTAEVRHNPYI